MGTSNDKMPLGKKGEALAKEYLNSLGYEFITANYRTKFGEIDLIFINDGVLIFVEVKTRRGKQIQNIEETINKVKIKKILKSAEIYISQSDIKFKEMRVDAIFVKFGSSRERGKDNTTYRPESCDSEDNITIKHIKSFL